MMKKILVDRLFVIGQILSKPGLFSLINSIEFYFVY